MRSVIIVWFRYNCCLTVKRSIHVHIVHIQCIIVELNDIEQNEKRKKERTKEERTGARHLCCYSIRTTLLYNKLYESHEAKTIHIHFSSNVQYYWPDLQFQWTEMRGDAFRCCMLNIAHIVCMPRILEIVGYVAIFWAHFGLNAFNEIAFSFSLSFFV